MCRYGTEDSWGLSGARGKDSAVRAEVAGTLARTSTRHSVQCGDCVHWPSSFRTQTEGEVVHCDDELKTLET